ncbi:hypothetical protein MRX96_005878 [Rhipicephalus microplus]
MRLFVGHPTGSTRSLRYQKYVRRMLRLFDVSASRSAKIISTIEAMNKLALDTLAPAMTAPEPRIVRMSSRDLTETAILPIPTGRLVLLFNEYLMWARRFSPYDVVEVENVGLLRSVVYILGLGVETQQALTLSLGLRVAHELGWMAHREIADVTLEIAGLPRSAHARHCLVKIENADKVLIGLFHKLMYNQSRSRSRVGHVRLSNNTVLLDWPPYHVDIKALLATLSAYRLSRHAGLEQRFPEFAAAFRTNLPHTQS